MAGMQCRNGSWRVFFRYMGHQYTLPLGEVRQDEVDAVAAKVDYWLMRLKQQLVTLPPHCDIVTFIQHDGRPPKLAAALNQELTLANLRDSYLEAQERRLEQNTIAGIRLHFNHLVRLVGPQRSMSSLTRPDLQSYVNRRAAEWIDPNVHLKKRLAKLAAQPPKRKYRRKAASPPPPVEKPLRHPSAATIKKEVVSLRTAWNWARRQLGLQETFPGNGLDYAKTEESLPFMTWEEAERRIAAGDDPAGLWECVYLRTEEVRELLSWIEARPISPWIYPMFCFAVFTGARRSEIVRALPSDVDLNGNVVTIREKKRDKKRLTTRRVPLTSSLKDVLVKWMETRANGSTLFCKGNGASITPHEAHNYFHRSLRRSKWSVLKGWHVFRHSFISALASKSVDQRIIDEMVGHQTDEQRRRYRHLYPDVLLQAIQSVFG